MRLALHAEGEPGRPRVVLLHGLFGSARNLGGLQRALAAEFHVLAPDLRNHGDSGHDEAMGYPAMAQDVLETLDDHWPAAVLGHSMGGKVAMTLALHAPDKVRRLLVADIAPVGYPSHFGAYVAAMLLVPQHVSRREADAALQAAVPDPAVRSFLLHNFRTGSGWRVGLAEIAAGLADIEAWPATGRSYGGPALFLTGEWSGYVRDSDRPAIRALFPAARFAVIRDAGHWLHAEQPAAFNAAVAAFLEPSASGVG